MSNRESNMAKLFTGISDKEIQISLLQWDTANDAMLIAGSFPPCEDLLIMRKDADK